MTLSKIFQALVSVWLAVSARPRFVPPCTQLCTSSVPAADGLSPRSKGTITAPLVQPFWLLSVKLSEPRTCPRGTCDACVTDVGSQLPTICWTLTLVAVVHCEPWIASAFRVTFSMYWFCSAEVPIEVNSM